MGSRRVVAWVGVGASAGALLAVAACDSVLGMNAPTLAPGADASLVDVVETEGATSDTGAPEAQGDAGATDAGAHDASPHDAGSDAPHDAGSDAAPVGIRCGGGSVPETWCTPGTQVCCQGGTVSAPTFTCVAAGTCLGYNIECADYNDCSGSDICCRFIAHQICDSTCTNNNEIVCDQATVDVCNGGKCDVPFVGDAAATSPYLGCGN